MLILGKQCKSDFRTYHEKKTEDFKKEVLSEVEVLGEK